MPIALGLLAMMYPVLAKVRYDEIGHVTGDSRLLGLSLAAELGRRAALMFVLAWTFLADQPEFRTGLIVVGLARCIAMVLIWNDLACGDREAAALLVALNSVFQIFAYSLSGLFYLQILPGWLGWQTADAQFSTWAITKSVLIFLGIPLVAGYLTRRIGVARKGKTGNRALPAPDQTDRPVRAAVHDRGDVRAAGAADHQSTRSMCSGSPSRCCATSRSCGSRRSSPLVRSGWTTRRRPPWPSQPPATTSNWPSPSASGCGASPAAKRWPARRTTHRGARPGGAGVRVAVAAPPPVLPHSTPTLGDIMTHKPSVLFVCVHNAGRSQMAAAFLTHLSRGQVEVRSAGSAPADRSTRLRWQAMAEVGIDMSAEMPKVLTTDAV